jgi:hypothetical protein
MRSFGLQYVDDGDDNDTEHDLKRWELLHVTPDYNVSLARVWVCIRARVRFKIRARVWVRNGVRLRFGDAVKFGIVAQLVSKFYRA